MLSPWRGQRTGSKGWSWGCFKRVLVSRGRAGAFQIGARDLPGLRAGRRPREVGPQTGPVPGNRGHPATGPGATARVLLGAHRVTSYFCATKYRSEPRGRLLCPWGLGLLGLRGRPGFSVGPFTGNASTPTLETRLDVLFGAQRDGTRREGKLGHPPPRAWLPARASPGDACPLSAPGTAALCPLPFTGPPP